MRHRVHEFAGVFRLRIVEQCMALALLDDGSIEVAFAYHNGDEAILKANPETSSTAC